MTDNLALRKARGAFFTPPELADFVTDWALRAPTDTILEPSCGEASFLIAAGTRLQRLGCATTSLLAQLHGAEIHEDSIRAAAVLLSEHGLAATIHPGNFFDLALTTTFDAVVGNPPYVRYQNFIGESRAKAQQAALAQGVRLAGLASSWAAFAVHAAQFLKPDGRMGLVLPAELLTANYAAPVRRFLVQRFAKVRLVLFEARVFPGVLEEVVLLLAEGTGPTDHCELYQAKDLTEIRNLKARKWTPIPPDQKWTPALLPQQAMETYAEALAGNDFCTLQGWGETSLGMVTGNNDFFALSVQRAKEVGLREGDVIRISPPSSRHLRGLTFTDSAWSEMARAGARVYLFYPDPMTPSAAAKRYIATGEAANINAAYKCQVRSPWWRVPAVGVPDLFFTYMNYDAPRLVANRARLRYLNSIHGVKLKKGLKELGGDLLPLAMLNSLTLLGAELVGRSYGGGILKLEPKEADVLPLPSPDVLRVLAPKLKALAPQLSGHLRRGELLAAAKLVDRVLLAGHLHLTSARLQVLRDARETLFARRVARSGKP